MKKKSKKRFKKRYIPLGIAIILIILSIGYIENPTMMGQEREGVMLGIQDEEGAGISNGKQAINFVLETPEKEIVELKDFRGKQAVLLNFWASWCAPCEEEMPLLQKAKNENSNIEVLAVNLQEKPEVARLWIDERGFDFVILMDPLGDIKTRYNIFTQPVTYFIDKEGVIRDRKFGALTEEELYQKLEKII